MGNPTKKLPMIERDGWLLPVEKELTARHESYLRALREIEKSAGSIVDYANGYRYFGWQRDEALEGWWFREWLPGAQDVYLLGDFNGWQRTSLRLDRNPEGVWSIFLPDAMYAERLTHGSLYKIHVHGDNGWHDRIPAYATRVVQDEKTKNFTAQFWNPVPFDWQGDRPIAARSEELLIYEAHVGMAQEREGVGSYAEFTEKILPRIREEGYDTVQLMGIAEHPYYGSFGYHVSNFFAPSSRFGTPEALKTLVRTAHELGLAVVMDLVHAHYVKNLNEGINELDGTDHLYSLPGTAGEQPYWDSKTFDYGKEQVRHFLLSNVKYWLDEFHFDGYRFDGVTSMIYHHHGHTDFSRREQYFDAGVNEHALTYLTLANTLVHDFRPRAVTIAEEVSGMPGIAVPTADGGVGFDYRLGMAIPDFWIRQLKEVPDEKWDIHAIWHVLTDRLPGIKTVAYAESHDQALVGDQTLAFRLMGKEMYEHMDRASQSPVIDRGMALHKMIRLVTISAGGDAYLNFMGNEFGHPEWIDFPREGNGWSYAYARRQWSLADNGLLRYAQLGEFDRAMIALVKKIRHTPRRLPLQFTDGHPESDDGLFARRPAVRIQLASVGLDTQLRSTGTGSGPLPPDPLDRRAPFRRHGADRHAGAAFLLPRAGGRAAPHPHLQHLAHGDGLPSRRVIRTHSLRRARGQKYRIMPGKQKKSQKDRQYTAAERDFGQQIQYNDEKIQTSPVRPRWHAHRPDGGHHPFGATRPAAFRYRSERPARALPLHRTAVRGVLPDILRLRRPPDQRSRSRITGVFHRKRHLRKPALRRDGRAARHAHKQRIYALRRHVEAPGIRRADPRPLRHRPYFSFVGGTGLDGSLPTKADVIAHVLAGSNITDRGTALMIGDRKYDILGAKTVGIDSAGVLYGYGDRAELEAAGADYILPAIPDLEELLLE